MRKKFTEVMTKILQEEESSVLILGDIGVHGFRSSLEKFPERAINFGIMEQTMISFAAGLSKEGINPTTHTIAPFLVERAYEQLKIDFGYQKLSGNFVSVGASMDYSALGCTHHCPGDVSALLNIPEFEIFIPGTSEEFGEQFRLNHNNNKASYFRLSELENESSYFPDISGHKKIKSGKKGTILLIGPVLKFVPKSVFELDIEIIYINKIATNLFLDSKLITNDKIIIIEPFFIGTINHLIQKFEIYNKTLIRNIGIKREFMTNYGNIEEMYRQAGLVPENIIELVLETINA